MTFFFLVFSLKIRAGDGTRQWDRGCGRPPCLRPAVHGCVVCHQCRSQRTPVARHERCFPFPGTYSMRARKSKRTENGCCLRQGCTLALSCAYSGLRSMFIFCSGWDNLHRLGLLLQRYKRREGGGRFCFCFMRETVAGFFQHVFEAMAVIVEQNDGDEM